jgi:hypothetical protein
MPQRLQPQHPYQRVTIHHSSRSFDGTGRCVGARDEDDARRQPGQNSSPSRRIHNNTAISRIVVSEKSAAALKRARDAAKQYICIPILTRKDDSGLIGIRAGTPSRVGGNGSRSKHSCSALAEPSLNVTARMTTASLQCGHDYRRSYLTAQDGGDILIWLVQFVAVRCPEHISKPAEITWLPAVKSNLFVIL